jgi:aspartyl-tRNA(Asn)/glutamyl-tRNA(Gln) amidotransferase subunit B
MPELPSVKRRRFEEAGLTPYQASTLTASVQAATYMERAHASARKASAAEIANWITGALASKLNEAGLDPSQSKIPPEDLGALVDRVADGTLSGRMAREVFDAMWSEEGSPDSIIEKRGLRQISDASEIEKLVDEAIAAGARQVADYRAGKEKALQSLVGQVMKASRGKANPAQVSDLLRRKLSAS